MLKRLFGRRKRKANKNTMTLESVLESFGIDIPESLEGRRTDSVSKVTFSDKFVSQDCVYIMYGSPRRFERLLKASVAAGVRLVVADKKRFEKSGLNKEEWPVVLVDDLIEKVAYNYKQVRDEYKGTVIAITGSLGKTTTRQYIDCVLGNEDKFVSKENLNAVNVVAGNVRKIMPKSPEYFIHEVGAGGFDTVGLSATMLRPNISVITNVREHHLSAYGNIDNIFNDKIQLIERASENAIAIVNFDDERLRAYEYPCKVITFGVDSADADYRATNVRQIEDILATDIVYEGKTVNITSRIFGEHNIYNILAAFAVGKYIGLDDDTVVERIGNYRTEGIRQNFKVHGENAFFMDCYNVSNDSVISAVKVLENYQMPENARKTAIIGGENKLGKKMKPLTQKLADELKDTTVSEIICFGTKMTDGKSLNKYGDALTLYNRFIENGNTNVRLITSVEELCRYLENNVKPGDAVLCKCIYWLNAAAAIDKVFGTSFCLNLKYIKDLSKSFSDSSYQYRSLMDIETIQITGVSQSIAVEDNLVIPDEVNGKNVFTLGYGLFADNDQLKTVDLGTSIEIIEEECFRGCKGICEIVIPDSVKSIMDNAFNGCTELKKVYIGNSIKHIGRNAFAGCNKLVEVELPEGIARIEENAFPENTVFIYRK